MDKTNTKKTVIVTAFATAIGAAAGTYAVKDLFKGGQDGNDRLIEVTNEVNKTLPMMIDSETRLDSTIGLNGTFTYNYTLINHSYEEIDSELFRENMESKLLANYCTSDEMKQFLENDVAISFSYFGKAGGQIAKFAYMPSDCENS